jgi:hypothetical protein
MHSELHSHSLLPIQSLKHAIPCRLSNQAKAINNARDLIANPANWMWAQKYQDRYGIRFLRSWKLPPTMSALLCPTTMQTLMRWLISGIHNKHTHG